MKRLLWSVVLAVSAAGCTPDVPGVGCASDSDCPETSVCLDSVCFENTCTPECGPAEQCVRTRCETIFTGLRLDSPSPGAAPAAEYTVTASLEFAEGRTAQLPAQLTLTATDESQNVSESALALVAGSTKYEGKFEPPREGRYRLQVTSPELGLSSDPVEVTVAWCPGGCASAETCRRDGCGPSFSGIELLAPAENQTVGANVEVTAKLLRVADATGVPPATLTLHAGSQTVELTSSGAEGYSGLWLPTQGGPHTLKVSSPELELESASITVVVDNTAPVFAIRVLSEPQRLPHEVDPDPAYDAALRRDEDALVEISSVDADVDPASVKLAVKGTSGEPKVFDTEEATSCESSAAFCRTASIPLGDPALVMNAFRGEFTASVSGTDLVGNESAAAETTFKVTRWKWAFEARPYLKSAPAIGARGDIYIGETLPGGKVYSISPDGTLNWDFQTAGEVTASIAVGELDGKETAFIAGTAADGNGAIWAIDGSNLAAQPLCSAGKNVEASVALTTTKFGSEASPLTTAVAVVNDNEGAVLLAVRPQASIKCIPFPLNELSGSRTGVAASIDQLWFGDAVGNVQGFEFGNSGWSQLGGWPVLVGAGNAPANPIVTASGIAGGGGVGVGRLFSIPLNGGSPVHFETQSPTWNMVQTSAKELVAGTDSGKLFFASEDLQGTPRSVSLSGAIIGAPAIGADKRLYVSTRGSKLYALTSSGTVDWELDLGHASESSPALDCARHPDGSIDPSRPGTLYVGTDGGKLFAMVVDSKGIDVDAPWPKLHRDPRNSSNASVDLRQFECK